MGVDGGITSGGARDLVVTVWDGPITSGGTRDGTWWEQYGMHRRTRTRRTRHGTGGISSDPLTNFVVSPSRVTGHGH